MSFPMSNASGFGPSKASGLKGTGLKQVTENNFTPQQMQLFQSLFSNVGPNSFTSRLAGGDPSQFEALEAPAWKQFGQAQSQTANQFSLGGGGQGAMSARRGSGFQNQLNQNTQDFAGALQAQRMGLQQNAIRDLMSMSQSLLGQRPYTNHFVQEEQPLWKQLATGLAGFGGQVAGSYLGRKF